MRRKDREVLGLQNILAILDKCEILHLALSLSDMPYVVPMNFAYEVADEQISVYLHCSPGGTKLDIISKNSNVCFQADCSYRLLTNDDACSWSCEFQSVIGFGAAMVVQDEKEKIHALDVIMKRYGFFGKPEYVKERLNAVTVLKIEVSSISGKAKM